MYSCLLLSLAYICAVVVYLYISLFIPMHLWILLVYGYDLICTCVPVHLFIYEFRFIMGVMQFILFVPIFIYTDLNCSYFLYCVVNFSPDHFKMVLMLHLPQSWLPLDIIRGCFTIFFGYALFYLVWIVIWLGNLFLVLFI